MQTPKDDDDTEWLRSCYCSIGIWNVPVFPTKLRERYVTGIGSRWRSTINWKRCIISYVQFEVIRSWILLNEQHSGHRLMKSWSTWSRCIHCPGIVHFYRATHMHSVVFYPSSVFFRLPVRHTPILF